MEGKKKQDGELADISGYRKYLEEQTTYRLTTIHKYVSEVSCYFMEYGLLDKDSVKKYIVFKNNRKHNIRAKYALQQYLKYKGYKWELPKIRNPERAKIRVFVKKNDIMHIINEMPKQLFRDLAFLQATGGLRASEAITIRENHILWDRCEVQITAKGGRSDIVLFPERAIKILEEYKRGGKGYLFLGVDDHKLDPDRVRAKVESLRSSYWRCLNTTAKRLGFEGVGTHTIRRMFGTTIWEISSDVKVAQELLRHRNIDTTASCYLPPYTGRAKSVLRQYQDDGGDDGAGVV